MPLFDIQNPPQIPQNSPSNRHKRQQPDHLTPQGTSEEESGGHEVEPPFGGEFASDEFRRC